MFYRSFREFLTEAGSCLYRGVLYIFSFLLTGSKLCGVQVEIDFILESFYVDIRYASDMTPLTIKRLSVSRPTRRNCLRKTYKGLYFDTKWVVYV